MAHISRDVHIARIGADLVWLDLRSDSYHVLRGAGESCRTAPDGSIEIDEAFHDALESVIVLGALEALTPDAVAPREPATGDAMDEPVALSAGALASTALDLALSAALFVRQPIRNLVRRSGPTPRSPRADVRGASLLAAEFAHLLSLSPWPSACLFHAFALRRRLRRRGYDADWVFGVRTWPFQAHCWLQSDGVVLTDRVERLMAFTPLLVA